MLQNDDGTECRGEDEIAKETADHFENLFTSTQSQEYEEIFEGLLAQSLSL